MFPMDTVYLDVPDTYSGIPLKVQAICRYAEDFAYDYVMKVDDDVYIAPERFESLPLGQDYIGRFRGPYGNYPAHFASGFAYWLSKRAASLVAAQPWNTDWMDERFVANTLARHNIFGYNDPINYLVTGPHIDGKDIVNKAVYRSGTAFCEYRPDQLFTMHDALQSALPVANHPGLRAVQSVVVTDAILSAPPTDKIPEHKLGKR